MLLLRVIIQFSADQTHLSGIVADGEGRALIFGWGVSIAILGGEREAMSRVGVKLS